jgi:hypothetical protein
MKSHFIELTSNIENKKTLINIMKIKKVIESSGMTCIFLDKNEVEYYKESYQDTVKMIKSCYQ